MRIFAAGISAETNCFAPFTTGMGAFEGGGTWRGNCSASAGPMGRLFAQWRLLAEQEGHRFTEGLFAAALPAGPITRQAYEALRDEMLAPLQGEEPFDIVLLMLHGAMIADGYDDCEGDILARARKACGPTTTVGAVLDPHCHLSVAMVSHSDLLVVSREYPHTDYPERVQQLFEACMRIHRGEIAPRAAVFDCRMIGFFPTDAEPMAGFVKRLSEAERAPGIVAAAFIHGFELGDSPDLGCKTLVYADADPDRAQQLAKRLGHDIYRLRRDLLPRFPSAEEALDIAQAGAGMQVLADVGDNPGAGAAADNMGLLRACLARGLRQVVAGHYWDPMVASLCAEAGPGARLPVRVGGKSGPASGMPLDLNVDVRSVVQDLRQSVFGQGEVSNGLSVSLACEGVEFVVCSQRHQVFDREAFARMGIDLSRAHIVLLKSGQHFLHSFGPVASRVLYVRAPDSIGLDLAAIPHRKRDLDYFPRLDDPLGLDAR